MRIPKLFSADLSGVVDWIGKFIAESERDGTIAAVGDTETSSSASYMIPTAGAILCYDTTVPPGWYALNGGFQFVGDNPDLFSKLGYNFGGSGLVFNLPPEPYSAPEGAIWIIRR